MRQVLALLIVALITGCAGANTGSMSTGSVGKPFPTEHRQLVQQHVKKVYKDPYSIRDAEIAEPKLSQSPKLLPNGVFAEVWVVCVRANAKNTYGAYEGQTTKAFFIYENAVANVVDHPLWKPWCDDGKFTPFTEIMQTGGAS